MTSQEIERNNELTQVALDAELRINQAAMMIKQGQTQAAITHIEQAHRVCHRLENELSGREI